MKSRRRPFEGGPLKRVLIAGCGYVGAAAAGLFEGAGWEVEGWTRRGGDGRRGIDLGDIEQVKAAAGLFDLVIHAASTRGGEAAAYRRLYLEGARNLRVSFAQAVFVFVSSTSVYAQREGEWVTEESAAQPEHETGKILRETENFVLEEGGVVLRLAGLYGPGRSALWQRVLRGEAPQNLSADRFVNQLHRDDAASALFLIGSESEGKRGQIYNVVDDRPLLLSECYRWLAEKLECPLSNEVRAPEQRKRGNSNKRISNGKLRECGWRVRYSSFLEGMEKSVLPRA